MMGLIGWSIIEALLGEGPAVKVIIGVGLVTVLLVGVLYVVS